MYLSKSIICRVTAHPFSLSLDLVMYIRIFIFICIHHTCAFFGMEHSSNLKIFALSSFDFG